MAQKDNIDIDKTFKRVGELTLYQLLLICFIGNIHFLEPFVGYSFSFYGATPEHRFLKLTLTNIIKYIYII